MFDCRNRKHRGQNKLLDRKLWLKGKKLKSNVPCCSTFSTILFCFFMFITNSWLVTLLNIPDKGPSFKTSNTVLSFS